MNMNIDFPYRIAADGRTATTDDAGHVRDMIEIVLFTHPGERVMRHDFGTGLLQYIHAPNSPELAATLQVTLQASLTRWLADLIDLKEASVESIGAELRINLTYILRSTGTVRQETFMRPVS
jgi:phage baseplate assembly protein W